MRKTMPTAQSPRHKAASAVPRDLLPPCLEKVVELTERLNESEELIAELDEIVATALERSLN